MRSDGLQFFAVRRVPGVGSQMNLTPAPAKERRELYAPCLEGPFDMICGSCRRVLQRRRGHVVGGMYKRIHLRPAGQPERKVSTDDQS